MMRADRAGRRRILGRRPILRRALASSALAALLIIGFDGAPGPGVGSCAAATVRVPFSYRSWTLADSSGDASISQTLLPITVAIPMNEQIGFIVSSGAQASKAGDGTTSNLNGATDVRAAVVLKLLDRRLVFQTGLNVPSGPTELDGEQQQVASELSPPPLGFRLRQPGRGMDFGVGLTYALPLSPIWSLGVGGGHVIRGKFRPTEGSAEITPGAETSLTAGMNARWASLSIGLEGVHRLYGEDEGGTIPFEEPSIWEGSLAARTLESSWLIDVVGRIGEKEDAEGEPVGSSFSGTYASGDLRILRSLSESFSLGVAGQIFRFRGDLGTMTTTGIGPALGIALGSSLRIDTRLQRLFGDTSDGFYEPESFDGWDVSVGLTVETGGAQE